MMTQNELYFAIGVLCLLFQVWILVRSNDSKAERFKDYRRRHPGVDNSDLNEVLATLTRPPLPLEVDPRNNRKIMTGRHN
jgi:hypothetical protein